MLDIDGQTEVKSPLYGALYTIQTVYLHIDTAELIMETKAMETVQILL